jgi:outer membrane cobalamin receptor
MEFSFKIKDLNCYQNLILNMEFLPNKNWQRKSYSSLLTANTSVNTKYKNLNLITTLQQEYFRFDENQNYLPFIFDLSFEVQYPIEENLMLSAQLQNIFHTPYQMPGNLPSSGRAFFIMLKYCPLS